MEDRLRELLPCPFCGGQGRYTNNYDTSTDGGEYVTCDKCLTSTALVYGIKEDPKPLLAERWNTRATDPLLEEMAEALYQVIKSIDGSATYYQRSLWSAKYKAEQALQEYREKKDAK